MFTGDRLSAIFDWELATIGDPLADVGYLVATWAQRGRSREHGRVAEHGHAPARLPDARRSSSPATRSAPGARCPTCAGTRRSRCGSRRSSSRAPTSAASRAPPTTRSSTASKHGVPEIAERARRTALEPESNTRPAGRMSDFSSAPIGGRLARTPARMSGNFGQGQGCSSLREWDRWRCAVRRTVSRRRRHGLDTGAAVNSIHPPDAEALVAAATERARDGDEDALRLLYLLYADNVFGYVLAIVARRARRRGHHQRGLRAPAAGAQPLPGERHPLRGMASAGRPKRCARPPASAAFGAAGRGPRAHGNVHRAAGARALADLRAALEALPDDQRQVMLLRLVAGLTPGEVAERLGPLGRRRPRAPAPRAPAAAHGAHPGRLGAAAPRTSVPRAA